MKKLLSILALALAFVACQTEPNDVVSNADLVDVVLNVAAPELDATRVAPNEGKGSSASGAITYMKDEDWNNFDLRYTLEVYAENGQLIERQVKCLPSYDQTMFEIKLVPKRIYKFVVFADFVDNGSTADLYYDTTDLTNITAITTAKNWNAMHEQRDAYFITKELQINVSTSETLTLTRPFAKLRVIATDIDSIEAYSEPGYVEVAYYNMPIYKSFNAVTGKLNTTEMGTDELTYEYPVKQGTYYYAGKYDADKGCMTLFTDYLLAVEGEQSYVNFKMTVYEANENGGKGRDIHTQDFSTTIPIQRNHLTTIVGDLLTTQANIIVEIDNKFEDEYVREWDGDTNKVNSWESGAAVGDNYQFVVNGESDAFVVTVSKTAVDEKNNLKAGTYTYEEDVEKLDDTNFNIAIAGATTRSIATGIVNATMNVEHNGMNNNDEVLSHSITLELDLMHENNEVRHVVYAYDGEVKFGESLATPEVTAAVEGNTVTLTWTAVEDATKYFVAMNDEAAVETTELFKVYENLEWNTLYTFSVKAANDTLESVVTTVEATTGEKPAVPTYKLYLNNEDGWAKVNVYAWDESATLLGDWPGTEVTEKETIEGVEYFVYALGEEFTGKTINVIFNNGEGKQTADITGVEITKDNFFTNYVEPVAPSDTVLYLKPNANWKVDGARFAAYFFGNGEAWVSMTLVEGETDIYAVTVPAGFENIIFCRMNPGTTDNSWSNKWNQTADLKVPTDGTNLYTVKESTWDNGGGAWSTYTPAVVEPEPEALATPEVTATVEGNVVTLSWAAVENAAQYGITVGTEMPVFVEETTYVFTGEYETEYTFNVVAVPADEVLFAVSEAAVVTATTEAEPAVEEEVLAELNKDAYYIYKPATEMKGGKWYAIVYENKAAEALTGNYGYIKYVEGIERTNGIALPANCAFGFLTVDGGYTIQQYDNKYVYQTGTYDSFNVGTTASSGHIWSITVEGSEFTITNNSTSKFVQYDTQYGSYGCYATLKGKLPTLYELVEVDNTPMILSLSSESLSFDCEGGEREITVTTAGTATLDASTSADWITVNVSNNKVTVIAEANSVKEPRNATINITFGEASATVNVSQGAFVDENDKPVIEDTKGTYESMAFLFDGKTITNASTGQTQGTNAYKQTFELNGVTYDALKLGTSKASGSFETAEIGVDGKSKLSFYAVGWKGKTVKLTVKVGETTETFTLKAKDGATGNPPYTALTFDDADYYSIDVTGISADAKVTFSTDSSGCRALICGVQLY